MIECAEAEKYPRRRKADAVEKTFPITSLSLFLVSFRQRAVFIIVLILHTRSQIKISAEQEIEKERWEHIKKKMEL